MKKSLFAVPLVLLAVQFTAKAERDTVPSDTTISVRTNEPIDIQDSADGRIYRGVVSQDVLDRDGQVAIPRGADAELIVRNVAEHDLALDLESVTVNGRRYIVSTENRTVGAEGIGKNERTAKYVGGGALLGTIIGAIAGGGKGAAVGAIAGGAAGAGAQVYTRGREVRVPTETLLTFRLDRPLVIGRGEYGRDNGYMREGHHYHYYEGDNADRRDRDRDQQQYPDRQYQDQRNQDRRNQDQRYPDQQNQNPPYQQYR